VMDWIDIMSGANVPLLQHALDQTQGAGALDARSWRGLVHTRLESLDMDAVAMDVRPFLERLQDAGLLTPENLVGLRRE